MKAGPSYQNVHEVIEGFVYIYTRPNSKKGTFHLRMRIRGRKGYIHESLGVTNVDDARSIAKTKYYEAETAVAHKQEPGKRSFKLLCEQWFRYREALGYTSTKYKQIYRVYWSEFFDKQRCDNLKDLSVYDIAEYWHWRRNYYRPERLRAMRDKKLNHPKYMAWKQAASIDPSHTTLETEVYCFKAFFKWAQQQGHCPPGSLPVVKNPRDKVIGETSRLRGTFTTSEYRRIRTEIEVQRRMGGKERNPRNGRKARNNPALEFRRRRLRVYFYLLASTGIRPSEARFLKFSMISSPMVRGTDIKLTKIVLPSKLAKRKPNGLQEGRDILSFDNDAMFNRIEEWRLWTKSTPNDLIFMDYADHSKAANLYTSFRNLLRQLDLHRDEIGRPRAAYALRKYYITQRIKHNTPLTAIAKNCGNDVHTIWKFYQTITTDDMWKYLTQRDPQVARAELIEQDPPTD